MDKSISWLLFSWRGRLDRMRFASTLAIIWVATGLLYQLLLLFTVSALFVAPFNKGLLLYALFAAGRPQFGFLSSPLFLTLAFTQVFLLYIHGALCAKRLHDMEWSGATLLVPAVIGGGAGVIIMLLFQTAYPSAELAVWGHFVGRTIASLLVGFAYAVMLLWLLIASSVEDRVAATLDYDLGDEWSEQSGMSEGRGSVQASPGAQAQSRVSVGRVASQPTFGRRHAI